MPRIAKFHTYFCKKCMGEDPHWAQTPLSIQLFLSLLCPPPYFSAPSYATDIDKYLTDLFKWYPILLHCTLFEFISVPYENQHQTLNIKKFDQGQIRLREYLFTHTCRTAGLPRGKLPLSLLSRGRFRKLPICFIFSSYRSIYDNKQVDKALFIFNVQ